MAELDTGINLLGMMNSGKTTAGRLIAEQIGVPFIDTDVLIADETGQKPGAIIQAEGPDRFMEIQREIVLGRLEDRDDVEIWATGGAVARDVELSKRLRHFGYNVFLFVDPDIVEARTTDEDIAKLANPNNLPFRELYLQERMPLYLATADIVVEVVDPAVTPDTTAARIVDAAERYVPDLAKLERITDPEELTDRERVFLSLSYYGGTDRWDAQDVAKRLGITSSGVALGIISDRIRKRGGWY